MENINIFIDSDKSEFLVEPINEDMRIFIDFLNDLEGYKTRLKNLHWSASSLSKHKLLDKFLSITIDFQDSIAEECMGIYNILDPNAIKGTLFECNCPIELLNRIKDTLALFISTLSDQPKYKGIISESDTYLHNINKYLYLFKICKD